MGNTALDPFFIDADGADGTPGTQDDDHRLGVGSGAIDAGANGGLPADEHDLDGDGDFDEPLPIDRSGAPRFVDDPDTPDTGNGTPPIVDMGAYEKQ